MSRDTELRDGEGKVWSLDNLCTQHWLDGQPTGAEKAAGWLNEKAVTLFREGKDAEAIAMKKLAKEMLDGVLPGLKKESEKHKTAFPEVIREGDVNAQEKLVAAAVKVDRVLLEAAKKPPEPT